MHWVGTVGWEVFMHAHNPGRQPGKAGLAGDRRGEQPGMTRCATCRMAFRRPLASGWGGGGPLPAVT